MNVMNCSGAWYNILHNFQVAEGMGANQGGQKNAGFFVGSNKEEKMNRDTPAIGRPPASLFQLDYDGYKQIPEEDQSDQVFPLSSNGFHRFGQYSGDAYDSNRCSVY